MQANWYHLSDPSTVASPALLIYPQQVEMNIGRMIEMVGNPALLMPHVKTHKMKPIVQMQIARGIHRFKCATFAEAQMLAEAGAKDILIAYQLNSPVAENFAALAKQFPQSRFSSLVDNFDSAKRMNDVWNPASDSVKQKGDARNPASDSAKQTDDARNPASDSVKQKGDARTPASDSAKQTDDARTPAPAYVYIDIDNGMHRTGIATEKAFALYERLQELPHVKCLGLHVYDGHIREKDLAARTKQCEDAFAPVATLAARMQDAEVIAGGTPTFPIHAKRAMSQQDTFKLTCSPGTCVLWDEGYGSGLPEQSFITAALLLARVISKPQAEHITLDLGHKAVSAENPITKRVFFHELADYEVISQSEEHLVVKTPLADRFKVGDVLYGTPWHVCPTVALYNEAQIIDNSIRVDTWPIARGRRLL